MVGSRDQGGRVEIFLRGTEHPGAGDLGAPVDPPGLPHDRLVPAPRALVLASGPREELDADDDDRERVAELVAEQGEEAVPIADAAPEARYRDELALSGRIETIKELATRSRHEAITLVYSAADEQHNQAVALKEFISQLS